MSVEVLWLHVTESSLSKMVGPRKMWVHLRACVRSYWRVKWTEAKGRLEAGVLLTGLLGQWLLGVSECGHSYVHSPLNVTQGLSFFVFFWFPGFQSESGMVLFSCLFWNKRETNCLITPFNLNVPLLISVPSWEFFHGKCSSR